WMSRSRGGGRPDFGGRRILRQSRQRRQHRGAAQKGAPGRSGQQLSDPQIGGDPRFRRRERRSNAHGSAASLSGRDRRAPGMELSTIEDYQRTNNARARRIQMKKIRNGLMMLACMVFLTHCGSGSSSSQTAQPATSASGVLEFTANMTGDQETPPVTTTTATG